MSKGKPIGYRLLLKRETHHEQGHLRVDVTAVELLGAQGSEPQQMKLKRGEYGLKWRMDGADLVSESEEHAVVRVHPNRGQDASVLVELILKDGDSPVAISERLSLGPIGPEREPPQPPQRDPHHPHHPHQLRVQLMRTAQGVTRDVILWAAIRHSTERIKFPNYSRFLDYVLCGHDHAIANDAPERDEYQKMRHSLERRKHKGRTLTGSDAYQALRDATDWFLKIHCGILPSDHELERMVRELSYEGVDFPGRSAASAWDAYTLQVDGVHRLPYLNIIREKLSDLRRSDGNHESAIIECTGLLEHKLEHPCFIELIWSYWQEEGMLVQSINAISRRFQNRQVSGDRDPLANLEIDPLRPLNNLLWGYVQNDLDRLSVRRRAYEYEHQYGLRLEGRALTAFRPAERRSKFIEGFHNLLQMCHTFFERDDQTTMLADGFPVLNAIKEVHYLLAAGAHNQFGDLPSTARGEMLIQQWLLGRPEMREFLGGRVMVPYPERWMDRVDAMKTLHGWSDTSVVHFNDLATFGEQIVLGLRFGGWSLVSDPASAANFCRSFRAEIQGYMHAYRAVTGVDLSAPVRTQQAANERNLPPSVHLLRRLSAGKRA